MEPKRSLLRSQKPSSNPYPESHEFGAHQPILSPHMYSILPIHPRLGLLRSGPTNSMELSTATEAASCAATRDHPNILRTLKVHQCIHKSSPLIPILSRINPIHATPTYISKRSRIAKPVQGRAIGWTACVRFPATADFLSPDTASWAMGNGNPFLSDKAAGS
jgi:hypothetical protein